MRPHTIMIVDDEEYIINSIVRLLRSENYTILSASNGTEALDIMSKNKVDLIIADQRMPQMTGIELLREVKRLYPDTVRMVLTGYADINAVIDAINKAEVYRFLTKPCDTNELIINIRQALDYYDLLMDNKVLLDIAREQMKTLADIERQSPGTVKLPKTKEGTYIIGGSDANMTIEDFIKKYFPQELK